MNYDMTAGVNAEIALSPMFDGIDFTGKFGVPARCHNEFL
jgi:hypothetical protein